MPQTDAATWWQRLWRRLGHRPWLGPLVRRIQPRIDRAVSRLTGGRHTLSATIFPTLIVTATGRKSGLPRPQPLAYVDADGGWAVIGTNYGGDDHPAWTHNLIADPTAEVTIDGTTHDVVARQVTDADERDRLWPRFLEIWPAYETYVQRSGREPRIFVLERL